jgi:hypothetical protein
MLKKIKKNMKLLYFHNIAYFLQYNTRKKGLPYFLQYNTRVFNKHVFIIGSGGTTTKQGVC